MGMYYGATLLYGFELVDDRQSPNYVEDRDWDELESLYYRKGSELEIFTPNYYGWDNSKFLLVKESYDSAELGTPQAISLKTADKDIWDNLLFKFCEQHGFKFEEPDWWLIAYMH